MLDGFIYSYQTLIGSFLGVTLPIGLWYAKDLLEARRQKKRNRAEIHDIFFMAGRESEEAVKNIRHFTGSVRNSLNGYGVEKFHVFTTPRFSRVYINEDRLFELKHGLDFETSQQIDIAVSAAKMFNGYLDQFEKGPDFIFESTVRMLESGLISKEKAQKEYFEDTYRNIGKMEGMLKKELISCQRHMLRPIVALAHKRSQLKKWCSAGVMDRILDDEASQMLSALKIDASSKI